jgi:acyl-CoA hydrolase
MTTEERIKQSETRIFKAVFPNTTNHYDTLFGGTAMHMMDEVAFIAACYRIIKFLSLVFVTPIKCHIIVAPNGMYFIKVVSPNWQSIKKVIIQI